MYKRYFKRLWDVVFSAGGLLIVSPLLLFLMAYIYLKTKQNPIFLQKRSGMNGKIFTLIKLRTMESKYDPEGNLLPDKDRITQWGYFLRKTSIDEIPQLINVLTGDMSLIGPRPLLPEYLPFYSDFHKQRHQILPGITGWAQTHGRNAVSWQQRLDMDVWYVHHYNFKTDLEILRQTIKTVFSGKDINYSDSVTMPDFDETVYESNE